MVEIVPGSQFSIVNSRYEAGAAANVRTNKWGGGSDEASDSPAVTVISYNGLTNIPAGALLQIRNDLSGITSIATIIGTTVSANLFPSQFSASDNGLLVNISVTATAGDQLYLIQGSFTSDGSINAGQANYILNGTVLHGLSTQSAWVPLTNACSGGSTATSRVSRLHPTLSCYNVFVTGSEPSGYFENDKLHSGSKRNILNAISDLTNNWTFSAGRYNLNPNNSLATSAGKTFSVTAGLPDGNWIGDKAGDVNNWFNCGNWFGLTVPDENTNVITDANSLVHLSVLAAANFSDENSDIAKCKNLTISAGEVRIIATNNNKLEVFGNLTINGTGTLDMSDSINNTPDGQLYLTGNWTNNRDETFFRQGESTVYFNGTSPQIINNVPGVGTEVFYNVVMNNNFNTAVSNDLYALGNLTLNATKTLNIASNDFVEVDRILNNSGTINVQNNGSLIQAVDNLTNTNSGTFNYNRIASIKKFDYVYWSKPISATFTTQQVSPTTPTFAIYKWTPTGFTTNGAVNGIGGWETYLSNMEIGRGYIIRGAAAMSSTISSDLPVLFSGAPNNGSLSVAVSRGAYDGADYTGTNNAVITKDDDNWNLLGNPYPSAIDAVAFLNANINLQGNVHIWTHGTLPLAATSPAFYNSFQFNYSQNDYLIYNASGASTQNGFDGKIASGQGFFVKMIDGGATTAAVNFSNTQRKTNIATFTGNNANNQFYRTNILNSQTASHNRIWLDLIKNDGETNRIMVGYIDGATNDDDRMFDATADLKDEQKFYSLIGAKSFVIQGRGLPFDKNDEIPLGIKGSSGSYTIAINAVDGFFINQGQTIYLEDQLLNIVHNLSLNPYNFSSNFGVFNNRFLLKFDNTVLANPNFIKPENVVVYKSQDAIVVNSKDTAINAVSIYDSVGRKLFEKTNLNTTNVNFSNINANNQILLVKVTLTDSKIVVRKILF